MDTVLIAALRDAMFDRLDFLDRLAVQHDVSCALLAEPTFGNLTSVIRKEASTW
ncbi:hypothetical protein KIPE111705_05450 [Kibdelosporangium persicum]|uniref:hypothetical protein n=1 Tax=Kibdelosporangium persicum TaxID=2698649 RepID=UPI00156642C5|nr:hypothetical protein [Kibdelosporangium persicum]